jgi:hypothetical protein
MGQVHGSKGVLFIDDQAAACQEMTGDTNSITFGRSKNNPESTTMGLNTVARIDGLRDATLDVTSVFDSGGAEAVVGLLDDMYAGSLVSRMQYLPAGSVTGEPIYTASMRLSSYAHNQPVDGVTTTTYSLAIASGSVTAACAV